MKKIFILLLWVPNFLITYDLNAQFVESYLSQALGEEWVAENKIREITIIEKWANIRGKLIKKNSNTYTYTDSVGLISKGDLRTITRTDTSKLICTQFKSGESSCHELFYSGNEVTKIRNQGIESYFTYNSENKFKYVWIDNQFFNNEGDEFKSYFYENGRLVEVVNKTLRCYTNGNNTDNSNNYTVKRQITVQIIYNKEGLPIEINLYRGVQSSEKTLFRVIKHEYNSQRRPVKSSFYGIVDGNHILEIGHEYLYR